MRTSAVTLILRGVPAGRLGSICPTQRHVVGVSMVAATTGPLSPNWTFTVVRVMCDCEWVNCTEMLPVISHVRCTSWPENGVAI